ncbi:MAG: hypothetical protein AAF550_00295 [Myxococcota bacterium]
MEAEASPLGTHRAGVVWHGGMNKWQARIKRNDTLHHLGTFDTEEEAIAARETAELKMDGKVSGKRIRSAFDDAMDELYPTSEDRPKPATGVLPELPSSPEPLCTVTPEELFAFIRPRMTLMGSMVVWKGDARKAVHHLWGKDCESLISFSINGEGQVVRQAEVSWMLTQQMPIPTGHVVKHSDGNVMNREPHNLWLVKVTD